MSECIEIYSFSFNDRSGKVRWLANELELLIEEHKVEIGSHREKPYIELNPFATVPTIFFRNKTLFESTAICHFLAESFPEKKLTVFSKEPKRFELLKWIAVFSESIESKLVDVVLSDAGMFKKDVRSIYEKSLRAKLTVAMNQLPKSPFILGDRLTIADIIAAFNFKLAVRCGFLLWTDIQHYLEPLMQREAAIKSHFFDSLETYLTESGQR